MPQSYDPHLSDYPLYIEGYDHGVADADRGHRHDVPLGILVGTAGTYLAIHLAPYLSRMLWP